MNSREDILGRVRARIGRTTDRTTTATGVDAVENWLQARQPGPRPAPAGDLLATFKEKSETLATTVDVVDDASAVPATVARYLAERSLPMRAVGWLELDSQPWRDAGIAFEGRGVVDADLVGITGCFCAIAETATLMLLSGPNTPATVSLLPETHIAIVAASRVVPAMEDAWAAEIKMNLPAFREYAAQVYAATDKAITELTDAQADEVINTPFGAPQPRIEFMGNLTVVHTWGHMGEIAAIKGIKMFASDHLCRPWYFGGIPTGNVPNSWDYNVVPGDGKMVDDSGCFEIPAVDPILTASRKAEIEQKLTTAKPNN